MIKLLKAEKKIRHKELKDSESPHSLRSFERALLSSPNSSFLWIKYSAFILDTQGLEKSREILERALTKIDSSEEREKLNVYLALMNLEFSFGNPYTFEKITIQAMAVNNPEKILRHKARKHLQTNSLEEAEEILKNLCKKYSSNIDNWERLLLFYIKDAKDESKFQEILRRGIQSLRDSVELRKRVGILEYNHGSQEKGRTIFENLVAEKPKRSDIWTIYINLEAICNSVEALRDLYERVLSIKLSQKCIAGLAKSYYTYEMNHHHTNKAVEVASRFQLAL